MTKLIRRPYGPQFVVGISFDAKEDLAQQSFKDECDINTIMARYMKTGEMPAGHRPPRYEDLTRAVDYHAAMNMLHAAESMFSALPAKIRERFSNDPAEYLAAIEEAHDPAATALRDELIDLGLLERRQEPSKPSSGGAPAAPSENGSETPPEAS